MEGAASSLPLIIESGGNRRFRRDAKSAKPENITTSGKVEEIMRLLSFGDEKIVLRKEYTTAIVVIGLTGSGKSAVALWLAGKDHQLTSVARPKGSHHFTIEDTEEKISKVTTVSKTKFPALVVDNVTNVAFYDCPGFNDSRGSEQDIAQAYYIKKVFNHLTGVKLIMAVDYAQVVPGGSRDAFLNLLRHASALIKDVDKFKNSIFLVVTKVSWESAPDENGVWKPLSDEALITTIVAFFAEARRDLSKKSADTTLSAELRSSSEKKIKFIDIFLTKEGGKYTKIDLFRKPSKSGRISDFDFMVEGKKRIREKITKYLNYTEIRGDDFGYSVSDLSKNEIHDMIVEIDSMIRVTVKNMVRKIEKHYNDSSNLVMRQLNFLEKHASADSMRQSGAEGSLAALRNATEITESLTANVTSATTDRFVEQIKQGFERLRIPALNDNLSTILHQGTFYKLVQDVRNTKAAAKSWEGIIKPLEKYLTDLNQKIRSRIEQTARNLRTQINQELAGVGKELKNHYRGKISVVPLEKMPHQYLEAKNITLAADFITNSIPVTAQTMLEAVEYVTSKITSDSSASKGFRSDLSRLAGSLEYLDTINGTGKFDQDPRWKSPFKELLKYFEESATWFGFLGDLFVKLSSYNQIKAKTVFGGGTITKGSYKNFLKEIDKLKVSESNAVESLDADDERLDELNEVLEKTVKSLPHFRCRLETMFIEGDFIMLSDFILEDGSMKICSSGTVPRQYNIFALHKLFIDRDLIAVGKNLSVAAISPRWEVIGSRKIDLSGLDGAPHASAQAAPGLPGQHGEDGASGRPGGDAGEFFGIADLFLQDSGKLSIILKGGAGGPGQDGGDGGNGTDGKSPDLSPEYYHHKTDCNEKACAKLDHQFECTLEICTYYHVAGLRTPHIDECEITLHGESATDGGQGGDGGVGGIGGHGGGHYFLIMNYNETMPEFVTEDGPDGSPGKHGEAGQLGQNGKLVSIRCHAANALTLPRVTEIWKVVPLEWSWPTTETVTSSPIITPAPDLGPPETGLGSDEIGLAFGNFTNVACIINDYKTFLRNNLKHKLSSYTLTSFLDDLNGKTLEFYGTLDLIGEMRSLEEHLKKNNLRREALTASYESLLDRVIKNAEDPREWEKSMEYKKARTFLYTTILSKLQAMKTNAEYTMIVEIESYLDLTNENIKTLMETKDKNTRFKVIRKRKEAYKDVIDEKIKQAENLIEHQLKPVMSNIRKEIDGEMGELITEIKEAIKKQKTSKKEFIEQSVKLRKNMILKKTFAVIETLTSLVSVLGPKAAAVGKVVGQVSSIAKPLLLGEEKKFVVDKAVIGTMKSVNDLLEIRLKEKKERYDKALDAINKELSKESESQDVVDNLKKIQEKSKGLLDGKSDAGEGYSKLDKHKQSVKNELSLKATELENKVSKNEGLIKKLKRCTSYMDAVETGFDLIQKLNESEDAIHAAADTFRTIEDNLAGLENLEARVYSSFGPMLSQTKKDVEQLEKDLGSKSQVALDFTKWNVQRVLHDVKEAVHSFTQGREVQNKLVRCIEIMSEVMTTLITIYDRIQNFQQQGQLADYIAEINAVTTESTDFTNQRLAEAVRELDISMRMNLILDQYNTAVRNVKQWVFPFANNFLDDFNAMQPSVLRIKSDDINDLFNSAVRLVSSIRQKVKEYKSSVRTSDKFIHYTSFNGDSRVSSPFSVWNNEEYMDMISRLLAGEEISLNADVAYSPQGKDAIKFNRIEINFKATNATLQSELDKKLEDFGVIMTHMGNSYYRFKNTFYVVSSDGQEISYTFTRKPDGSRWTVNKVYTKILHGDIMLSPYAMWKIKLRRENEKDFDVLKVYANAVNLELTGEGSYIKSCDEIPAFEPGDYYKLYENDHTSSNITSPVEPAGNRHRRSIALPVSSSARRPSSWLNTIVSSSKQFIDKLRDSFAYSVPAPANNSSYPITPQTLMPNLPMFGHDSSGSGTEGHDGNAFSSEIDMNGILAWGTLISRKWSGYRPRPTMTAPTDLSSCIELAIRSHGIVDIFISSLQGLDYHREIVASKVIENHKLYRDCVEIVYQKLMRGEDTTVASTLVRLVAGRISQLEPNDLHRLLSRVAPDVNDLTDQSLLKKADQCAGDTNIGSPADTCLLPQETLNRDPLHLATDSPILPQVAFDLGLGS